YHLLPTFTHTATPLNYTLSLHDALPISPLINKITPHNIYGNELSNVTFSSTVCLNLLRSQNAGAHNMRTFEIPSMGGLMLTTRSDRKSTRLNSSHEWISYAVFCLKTKT